MNQLDPTAPPYDVPSTTQALWNALFKYFARGKDTPATLEVEPVLPSEALDSALLELGATKRDSPRYVVARSAIFQQYDYASDIPETHHTPHAPFPYLPVTPSAGAPSPFTHPLRPPKPHATASRAAAPLYSRFLPHLTADPTRPTYFKLEPCTLAHLATLHGWMNDPRVDQFWMEKGSLEEHRKFIDERTKDPHSLSVIGSYVELEGDKEKEAEPAVYAEIYWVKVRPLSSSRASALAPDLMFFSSFGNRRTASHPSCPKVPSRTTTAVRPSLSDRLPPRAGSADPTPAHLRAQACTCSSARTTTAARTASARGCRRSPTTASSTTRARSASCASPTRRTARSSRCVLVALSCST